MKQVKKMRMLHLFNGLFAADSFTLRNFHRSKGYNPIVQFKSIFLD